MNASEPTENVKLGLTRSAIGSDVIIRVRADRRPWSERRDNGDP